MKVSEKAIDVIINAEISSPEYYKKKLQVTNWPGGASGLTVGIGYDLGYNTKAQIAKDWAGLVDADTIKKLQSVAGYKGEDARKQLGPIMKSVSIPLEAAEKQFYKGSVPRYAQMALKAYPGLDQLLPDAAGAIVSLVFNRGTSFTGSNRREMKELKPLIASKDYNAIADKIVEMKRLWQNTNLTGLLARRDAEAALVRNANRQYSENEIINV